MLILRGEQGAHMGRCGLATTNLLIDADEEVFLCPNSR
ncbi:MAG: hypothetical protein K0S79_2295 [Nitrospira sp.]|nr:hypothetical protein [Nitrospira sp.]